MMTRSKKLKLLGGHSMEIIVLDIFFSNLVAPIKSEMGVGKLGKHDFTMMKLLVPCQFLFIYLFI